MVPHHLARYGWAFTGLSLGLAVSRLLYEVAPLQFRWFGALPLTLAFSVLAAAAAFLILSRVDTSILALVIPTVLTWLYILTPATAVDPLRGALLVAASMTVIIWFSVQTVPESRWIGPLLVGGSLLTAYLLTLQRTVGRADTFEFQVTAPVLGIAHPTGYPLYTLIGGLFSVLPLGQVATRINLTSVVSAVGAGILLFILMRRILKLPFSVALPGAIWVGLTPVLWSQAIVAEVYAFNALLASAILLTTLSIAERHPSALVANRNILRPVGGKLVLLLFLLCGLSLTNHLTTVFLLPGAVLALIMAWPRLKGGPWAIAVAAGIAALLIYLYIPIRWPALHNGALMPFSEFIGWITGSRFSGALQLRAWYTDSARWSIVGRLLVEQVGWLGAGLGAVGFLLMVWKRWRITLILLSAFMGYGFYGLNYLIPDIAVFLIPMYIILAMLAIYGLSEFARLLSEQLPSNLASLPEVVVTTLIVYLAAVQAWTLGPAFNWADEVTLEQWGRYVLSQPLDPEGAILADSEKIAPLEYLHRIEGQQPEMAMVVLGTEQEYVGNLFARLEAQQTVYLARLLPGLEGPFHLRSVGPVIEVGTQPLPLASNAEQVAQWENGLQLVSAHSDTQQQAGTDAHVTLQWQTDAPISDNAFVHLRLIDGNGSPVWSMQPQFPVSNRYPLVAWKPPEMVPDYYAVPLSKTLNDGNYALEVALAPPYTTDYLQTTESSAWVTVSQWMVNASDDPASAFAERRALSQATSAVMAINLPQRMPANALVDAQILRNQEGNMLTANIAPEVVAEDRAIYTLEGDQLRCGWLQPLSDQCVLGMAQLTEPTPESVANYNNQVLLTGIDFASGQIVPGQTVDVALEWQALQPLEEDYTVFVHLLGPDGQLHGQVDSWPVQGTYPTSAWPLDEPITDRYQVQLNADAPAGAYRVEVGLYLLATNTRLPLVDEAGTLTGDKLSLSGLVVPQ